MSAAAPCGWGGRGQVDVPCMMYTVQCRVLHCTVYTALHCIDVCSSAAWLEWPGPCMVYAVHSGIIWDCIYMYSTYYAHGALLYKEMSASVLEGEKEVLFNSPGDLNYGVASAWNAAAPVELPQTACLCDRGP